MVLAAVGQICSTSSMTHNLAQARKVVSKAAAAGAKVSRQSKLLQKGRRANPQRSLSQALFLPEASDYIGASPDETLSLCKPATQSIFLLGLQEEAKTHSLPISVGVHEPSDDPNCKRIKNTLLWINEQGKITQRYQKMHLFDVEIPGGPILKESNVTEAGSEILPPFDSAVGRVGAMICFDLRFPEISLALKRQNADVLLYPSAFTVPTGKAHWLPLLRTRAIECQAYVVAAAQVGPHSQKRTSYGHSVIIDPWGKVLAELGGEKRDEPEIALAEIDLERKREVKRNMPLLRRTDVYPEV